MIYKKLNFWEEYTPLGGVPPDSATAFDQKMGSFWPKTQHLVLLSLFLGSLGPFLALFGAF